MLHEQDAKALNLLLVLPQKRVLWVFIDDGLVFDVLGPVCISERGKRLVVVVVGRAHGRHHYRLGVAAQGVLQEAGQLRVTVRNVARLRV